MGFLGRTASIIGYCLAALTLPVAIATFVGMDFFARGLVEATGLKVSPWMNGGEVIQVVEHGGYQTQIHQPVFDGLFREKKEGFVQVDWTPLKNLPPGINEEVDFDRDGRADFKIDLDVEAVSAKITKENSRVKSLEGCYKLQDGRAVRIRLINKGQ